MTIISNDTCCDDKVPESEKKVHSESARGVAGRGTPFRAQEWALV